MRAATWLRVVGGLVWMAGNGCSSLREIQRADLPANARRHNLQVVTVDGLRYDFDVAQMSPDSLIGYRRRDVEGAFDEFAVVRLGSEDVAHLYSRGVDWYRTMLVAGGAAAVVTAVGLSAAANHTNGGGSSGGGKSTVP
jgi:hypothetical protein